MDMEIMDLLAQLTTEEKAALCAGADFWHTAPLKDKKIPSVMMTDGPHGLRKQKGKKVLGKSYPATCFPTAVTSACSFDKELLRLEGEAIGAEAKSQGVGMVLGPGLNIKRHPLCGRNFEYFSEDPCLSGELAAAFVKGVQSQGVGACLKHFACNSQEAGRMIADSAVDERALREIYLAGFETAVKKGAPMAVMGAYNKINGTYACENKTLLTDILRNEWGFEGMTVTDWGAMNDVAAAIEAGLDLEMPSSGGERTKALLQALEDGTVSMEALDRAAGNVLRFVMTVKDNEKTSFDKSEHHELARRIARESAVLLKNDGLLPLSPETPVALMSVFGEVLRYQGAGSSQVNPTDFTGPIAAMEERGLRFLYSAGKSLDEAAIAAKAAEAVILFAGLPAEAESEGFDRKTLSLPEEQNRLIETVLDVNPRTVVVLLGGGVMELPWADKAPAILYMGLGGQAVGGAAIDLIFGDATPSGRLAETWPLQVTDCPADPYFGKTDIAQYRESVFVGYRYYNTANTPVRYPFGHGLSYTTFSYTNAWADNEAMAATVTVTNTGDRAGYEVVQMYVAPPAGILFRPAHELRHFEKIWLEPGEGRKVVFPLMQRDFTFWNTRTHDWDTFGGTYTLQFGSSSRDIRVEIPLELDRPTPEIENFMTNTPAYYAVAREGTLAVPGWQFELLTGRRLHPNKSDILTLNSTLTDARDLRLGRMLLKVARASMGGKKNPMIDAMLAEMPFRAFLMGGVKLSTVEKLLARMNESRQKADTPFSLKDSLAALREKAAAKKALKADAGAEPEDMEDIPLWAELLPQEPEAEAEEEPFPAPEEKPENPKRKKLSLKLPKKKEKTPTDTDRI